MLIIKLQYGYACLGIAGEIHRALCIAICEINSVGGEYCTICSLVIRQPDGRVIRFHVYRSTRIFGCAYSDPGATASVSQNNFIRFNRSWGSHTDQK